MNASSTTTPSAPILGEGDVMKQAIVAALHRHSPEAAARFDASFTVWSTLPGTVVIRDVNRYWRRQLATLAIDTTEIREFLMDDCVWADWLRHFTRGVLPVVIAHNLPIL